MKRMTCSKLTLTAGLLLTSGLTGCTSTQSTQSTQSTPEGPICATAQGELTPDAVLADLMEGNARYVQGTQSNPDIQSRIEVTSTGQFPQAIILSCVDSRVPVEMVFDQGIGDIFVGRVAGNVATTEQIGSMEFATKLAGSKLVMVLGHSSCGAVKGACDGAELGNLTALLAHIKPAIDAVEGVPADKRNSKNKDYVAQVVDKNVDLTVEQIRSSSSVLRELEASGDIKIVGALYDLHDGSVTLK